MAGDSGAVSSLGEQIGAYRCELNKCPAVVELQPAPLHGELQAGAVFRGRALVAE
jgi:hypothetical protein